MSSSDSSSPASSTSSLPDVPLPQPKKNKSSSNPKPKSAKSKSAQKSQETVAEEEHDENWPYTPPNGYITLHHIPDAGEFDWDAVEADDDAELWVIRVPDAVGIHHCLILFTSRLIALICIGQT